MLDVDRAPGGDAASIFMKRPGGNSLLSDRLTDNVALVLSRCRLIGKVLVVGVSGGADSVALLLALNELKESHQLRLHLAHFDHGYRDGSAADALWVTELADRLHLDRTVGNCTGRAGMDALPVGLEAAGRRARYAFFANVAARTSASATLVGHTEGDQLETRLLHIVRGSGLRGLGGIAEDSLVRPDDLTSVRVIRPLLGITRAVTEAYCAERGIMPRCDPTNQDVRFARNRLRREVVPQLLKINPRLGVSLDRLGRIASDGEAFFEAELDRHIATWVEVCPTCWTLDRSHWVILHPSLKRGLLRRASLTLVPGSDVGADAIESAVVACDRWPAGKRVTWTDYREVAIEHTSIEIRLMSETVRPPASFDFDLTGTGKVDLTKIGWLTWLRVARGSDRVDDWPVLHYQHVTSVCRDRTYDRWHADLDRAALGKPPWVSVRSRRPGDWLAPAGMTGRKKIHDILVDAYIPGRLRDHVPIIESPNGIAWLVGLRRDRRFLASDACSDVICVEVVSSFRGQLKP